MVESIYVHIDTISNAVLTKGLSTSDFVDTIVHQPKNLLLLDASSSYGEYDTFTGLKVIRGNEEVLQFFNSLTKRQNSQDMKWIDFTDTTMLKELTPLEISELLYFGHTKNHLHSPFFYKLQNNFVFFDLSDNINRIYYRYLDEFYRVLANKISLLVTSKNIVKKGFFQKTVPVEPLNYEVLKEIRSILQEGVIFSFKQEKISNNQYIIPIYVVEDAVWKAKGDRYLAEQKIATLTYHSETSTWILEKELALFT